MPKVAIAKNQQLIFKQIGYNLEFTDGYIKEIAHQAFIEKTGARSLKHRVSKSAWKALDYAVDHVDEYNTVKFTRLTATDNNKYNIYKKEMDDNKIKKIVKQ